MEQAIYSGKTEEIISHALNELGLEYAFLKTRVGLPHDDVKHLHSKNLSAGQWFLICKVLHLSADSISYGYCRRLHKAQFRLAWERGLLDLPSTNNVRRLIREIRKDERENRRFQGTCYSRGLRFRIFYRSLGPNIVNVGIREYNRTVIQLHARLGAVSKYLPLIRRDATPLPAKTKVQARRWTFRLPALPMKVRA